MLAIYTSYWAKVGWFKYIPALQMKETDAKYTLTDPTEVMAFLTLLLQWGATPDNAWHLHKSCTGWTLKQQQTAPPATQSHGSAEPSHQQDSHFADGTSNCAHAYAQDHSDHLNFILEQLGRQDCSGLEDSERQASQQLEGKHDAPATPSSALHSPTAFARIRQFHGLPASSDRAMPASQWLTKTDSLTNSKPDSQSASPTEHLQTESGIDSPLQSSAAEPNGDQAGLDEYSQMVGSSAAGVRQLQSVSRAVCGEQIEAEGRPPTGKDVEQALGQEAEGAEEVSTPPPRTSLDHYLRQPYKVGSEEDGESSETGHMGHWDSGEGIMPEKEVAQHSRSCAALHEARSSGEQSMASMPPLQGARPGQRMPEGKRLTALLLDKLQGHDSTHSGGDEGMSPPGLSSHSTSSMAGYQSPFESLANEGGLSVSEDTDSIKAEIGSVASINLAPST